MTEAARDALTPTEELRRLVEPYIPAAIKELKRLAKEAQPEGVRDAAKKLLAARGLLE